MLDRMKLDKVADVAETLYKDTQMIGEKEFFEFVKRANRDLVARQRYKVLELIIKYIRGGNNIL